MRYNKVLSYADCVRRRRAVLAKTERKKRGSSDGWHWEKSIGPDGEIHGSLRYTGGWYRFEGTEKELRKRHLAVLALCLAGVLLYLPCLAVPVTHADNAVLSCALILGLFPILWMAAGLRRLLGSRPPFEVSVPQKSVQRLKLCTAGVFLCGAVSCVTQVVLMIPGGACGRYDLLFLVLMLAGMAAFAAAGVILRRYRVVEAKSGKEKENKR